MKKFFSATLLLLILPQLIFWLNHWTPRGWHLVHQLWLPLAAIPPVVWFVWVLRNPEEGRPGIGFACAGGLLLACYLAATHFSFGNAQVSLFEEGGWIPGGEGSGDIHLQSGFFLPYLFLGCWFGSMGAIYYKWGPRLNRTLGNLHCWISLMALEYLWFQELTMTMAMEQFRQKLIGPVWVNFDRSTTYTLEATYALLVLAQLLLPANVIQSIVMARPKKANPI